MNPTVERFLQATIGEDPGAMADCYAPEVVIEMPFAPPGLYPSRVEIGREQLRERFRAGRAIRRYTALDNVHIHDTQHPEITVIEYGLSGVMTASGKPFSLAFVMVMTIRDGLIVHTRDYTDPIAGARITGRIPELVAALALPAEEPRG
jgi:ketosteroid isomerase-like protein